MKKKYKHFVQISILKQGNNKPLYILTNSCVTFKFNQSWDEKDDVDDEEKRREDAKDKDDDYFLRQSFDIYKIMS